MITLRRRRGLLLLRQAAAAVPAADAADAAAAAAVAVVAGGVPAAEIVPTAGVTSDRDLVTGTRDTVESKTVEGG